MSLKHTEMDKGVKAFLIYMSSSVIIITVLFLVFFIRQALSPQIHYLDRNDIFEIVRDNRQTILEDIEKNDFSRTLGLLSSSREEPEVWFADGCVTFYCYGHGFASNTSYEGFYYTPWDGPGAVGGGEVPWQRYSLPEGEKLIQALKQEGNEWVWYEKDKDPGGDNEYRTEKICDNFWYYKLVY